MLMLKGCPRCSGDMHDTTDHYGRYLVCVQCGFNLDVPRRGLRTGRAAGTATKSVAPKVAA